MGLCENKLIVANTGSDSLSIIDTRTHELIDTIFLWESVKANKKSTSNGPYVGPHHIFFDEKDIIYSANSYNNTVYKINIELKEIVDMVYVGSFPSHLVVHNGYIYVSNSDSNSISVIEEKGFNIIENIPVGERPHDIKLDKKNNRLYISNNNGYSIDMVDLNNNVQKRIKLRYNPVHISIEDNIILVLSPPSNGMLNSKLLIYSINDECIVKEIDVQGVIVDLIAVENKKTAYVTNVEDGNLYEIDLVDYKINSKYLIGGMPNNITRKNEELYISDAFYNRVVIFNYKKGKILYSIDVGLEPNGIILI